MLYSPKWSAIMQEYGIGEPPSEEFISSSGTVLRVRKCKVIIKQRDFRLSTLGGLNITHSSRPLRLKPEVSALALEKEGERFATHILKESSLVFYAGMLKGLMNKVAWDEMWAEISKVATRTAQADEIFKEGERFAEYIGLKISPAFYEGMLRELLANTEKMLI